jgi:flavin-dependent dehydrogenase
VESGLLAASTIIEARGDYRGQRLAAYPERLSTRFGDGEGPADAFADLLPAGIRDLLARSLFSHPGLMRRLVLDRGFLHVKQPALAPVPVTTL